MPMDQWFSEFVLMNWVDIYGKRSNVLCMNKHARYISSQATRSWWEVSVWTCSLPASHAQSTWVPLVNSDKTPEILYDPGPVRRNIYLNFLRHKFEFVAHGRWLGKLDWEKQIREKTHSKEQSNHGDTRIVDLCSSHSFSFFPLRPQLVVTDFFWLLRNESTQTTARDSAEMKWTICLVQ